jgi:uncharacterized protein (TIGR00369 family)
VVVSVEDARRVLASQPFSVLVGARLTAFVAGAATIELDIREDLKQHNGFLHGGVLAFAADTALTFAGGSVLGASVLTGGMSISYLRPARGRVLRAHAVVTRADERQADCRAELRTVDPGTDTASGGTVVATATGTIAVTQPR